MPDRTFEVIPFAESDFYRLISNQYCDASAVGKNRRASYLYRYLSEVGARTIVAELDYTDRDYLDDFAAFYVRCFANYDRRCRRLHFFSSTIKEEQFLQIVQSDTNSPLSRSLSDSYLGFIVARPLPSAVIGRTLLQPTRTTEVDDIILVL